MASALGIRGKTTEAILRELASKKRQTGTYEATVAGLVARYDAKAAKRAEKEAAA